jgi:hypothetical protein
MIDTPVFPFEGFPVCAVYFPALTICILVRDKGVLNLDCTEGKHRDNINESLEPILL